MLQWLLSFFRKPVYGAVLRIVKQRIQAAEKAFADGQKVIYQEAKRQEAQLLDKVADTVLTGSGSGPKA